jgi:hypothetical protein
VRLARARRGGRGETELRIVNPAGAAIALQRAGQSLDEAEPLSLANGEIWLADGRYFVEASGGAWRQLFRVAGAPAAGGSRPQSRLAAPRTRAR